MFGAGERVRVRVRDHVLELARSDDRVVAAAAVGSLADGNGDRWSDLDLTFGVNGVAGVDAVLADWTSALERSFDALRLFDLPVRSTVYRVFLLPGCPQVDLSFTPASEFGALGPRFRLLFGTPVDRRPEPAVPPPDPVGLAVHHLLRARISVERGRRWQAAHWLDAAREHTLALACARRGLDPSHGRGLDDLPAEVLEGFEGALVRSLEREALLSALAAAVAVLTREAAPSGRLAARLRELAA